MRLPSAFSGFLPLLHRELNKGIPHVDGGCKEGQVEESMRLLREAGLAAVRMYRGLGELQAGSFSEARARFLRREEVPERPLRRSRPAVGEEEGAGNGGPEDEQQRGGDRHTGSEAHFKTSLRAVS